MQKQTNEKRPKDILKVYLEPETAQRLKKIKAETGASLQFLVRRAIEQDLAQRELAQPQQLTLVDKEPK